MRMTAEQFLSQDMPQLFIPLYTLHDGEIIHEPDILVWANWMTETNRTMYFMQRSGVQIITTFLGCAVNFRDGNPLLFETMVFGGELDQEQEQCATCYEAYPMYERMVDRVLKTLPIEEQKGKCDFLMYVREDLI